MANKKNGVYQTINSYWKFIKGNPLLIPVILAFCIRLIIILSVDFPLNDGGMFHTMVQDIINSNFALPHFTSYNQAGIPFAYPPLSFYLAAGLTELLPISLISIFRFLPFILSLFTVPAFYLLSKEIFGRKFGLLSTFVFVLLPRSFIWQIMGGGLARSLGFTFALLAIYLGIKLFKNHSPKNIFLTSLTLTLTLTTHLEWMTFAVYSLVILLFIFKNPIKNIINLIKVFFLTGILASPWWLALLLRHGIEPFINFAKSGIVPYEASTFYQLITFRITDEPFLTVWGVLSLLGIGVAFKKGFYWIVVWFLIPIILVPRSSPNLIVIPQAILITLCLKEVIVPAFINNSALNLKHRLKLKFIPFYLFLAFVVFYLLMSIFAIIYLPDWKYFHFMNKNERETMEWIRKNTPKDARFLVLSSENSFFWGMDPLSEWFPTLSQRASISTPQGSEWLPKNAIFNKIILYSVTRDCYWQNLICIENNVAQQDDWYSYIYLYKNQKGTKDTIPLVRQNLLDSSNYEKIYENNASEVFVRKN